MRRGLHGWRAVAVAALLLGCSPPEVDEQPSEATAPAPGVVQFHRNREAEAILAQLQMRAWVFKHRGGELTTEFTVSHRPAGRDQEWTEIYRLVGDDVVRSRLAESDAASSFREPEQGGYVILVFPELPRDGNIVHQCSLGDTNIVHTAPARKIIPAEVFSHPDSFETGFSRPAEALQLVPGETQILVEEQVRLVTGLPADERESIRFVLKATALQDGQLPDRQLPGQEGASASG